MLCALHSKYSFELTHWSYIRKIYKANGRTLRPVRVSINGEISSTFALTRATAKKHVIHISHSNIEIPSHTLSVAEIRSTRLLNWMRMRHNKKAYMCYLPPYKFFVCVLSTVEYFFGWYALKIGNWSWCQFWRSRQNPRKLQEFRKFIAIARNHDLMTFWMG